MIHILRFECQMKTKCGFFKFCYIIITYENNLDSKYVKYTTEGGQSHHEIKTDNS